MKASTIVHSECESEYRGQWQTWYSHHSCKAVRDNQDKVWRGDIIAKQARGECEETARKIQWELREGSIGSGSSEWAVRQSFHYPNLIAFHKGFRIPYKDTQDTLRRHKLQVGKTGGGLKAQPSTRLQTHTMLPQRVGPKVGFKLSSSQQERGNLAVTQFTMSRR